MNYISKTLQNISSITPLIKCLLVTATDIETNELHANMQPIIDNAIIRVHKGNYTYYIGKFGEIAVVHVQSGMGSIAANASIMTVSTAIDIWDPYAVIMVGIAFGKNEQNQQVGDVLVSETIIPYNIQKVSTNKVIQRGPVPPAGNVLVNRFKSLSKDWIYEIENSVFSKTFFGGILSGESLVDNIKYRDQLLEAYPTAIGGEMEGAGLFAAASGYKLEWIVVKGICDFADGKKSVNKQLYQQKAIRAAVNFCKHVLHTPNILEALSIHSYSTNETDFIEKCEVGKVLFDIYSKDKEPFYLKRKSDDNFIAYLDLYSVWISGESGCGKSSLIFRNLLMEGRDFKLVTLVHCVNFGNDEIFLEIYDQLNAVINQDVDDVISYNGSPIHKILEGICFLVAKAAISNNLIIILEELPLPEDKEQLKEFVVNINSLLLLNRSRNPDINLRIVLSSICSPTEYINPKQDKVREIFKFLPEKNWAKDDTLKLLEMILSSLNLKFTEPQKVSLIDVSKGSPRFVKNFVREYIITRVSSDEAFSNLLITVAHEFKYND